MADEGGKRSYLIDELKPDEREVTVIKWPGTDRDVGLLHLNVGELLDAHCAARELFRKRGIAADPWSSEALEQEEMTQQVFRMLVEPDARVADARVFQSVDQCRKRLDAEERSWFCVQHERSYGLAARGLTPDV